MAYIFDMASGTEYLDVTNAEPAENAVAGLFPGSDRGVEPQLAQLSTATTATELPAGFDIQSILDKLVD